MDYYEKLDNNAVQEQIQQLENSPENLINGIEKLLLDISITATGTLTNKIEENDHKFEQCIGAISDSKIPEIESILKSILDDNLAKCRNKENKESQEEQIAFNAFYALHIYYRHRFSSGELKNISDKYFSIFAESHNIVKHLEVLTKLNYREGNNIIKDDLLDLAKDNCKKFKNHVGVLHAFADVAVTLFEIKLKKEANPYTTNEDYTTFKTKWYDTAITYANEALIKEPEYGKFYTTKARLLSFELNPDAFDEATKLCFMARNKENPNATNYAMRISQYLLYETEISMRESMLHYTNNLSSQVEESINKNTSNAVENLNNIVVSAEKSIQETKIMVETSLHNTINQATHKNIEYLALFSAVICIFVTTASVESTPLEMAGLIMVLLGCIVSLFIIFNLFTKLSKGGFSSKTIVLYLISFIIGLALTVVGIWIVENSNPELFTASHPIAWDAA